MGWGRGGVLTARVGVCEPSARPAVARTDLVRIWRGAGGGGAVFAADHLLGISKSKVVGSSLLESSDDRVAAVAPARAVLIARPYLLSCEAVRSFTYI